MYFHRLLLLLIPAAYLLLPLVIHWWQTLEGPWYLPFMTWAAAVVVAFITEQRRKHA